MLGYLSVIVSIVSVVNANHCYHPVKRLAAIGPIGPHNPFNQEIENESECPRETIPINFEGARRQLPSTCRRYTVTSVIQTASVTFTAPPGGTPSALYTVLYDSPGNLQVGVPGSFTGIGTNQCVGVQWIPGNNPALTLVGVNPAIC